MEMSKPPLRRGELLERRPNMSADLAGLAVGALSSDTCIYLFHNVPSFLVNVHVFPPHI